LESFPGCVQQWNFDIQRQLPKGFFVDAAYAGSKGTDVPGTEAQTLDQLPDKDLSLGTALDNSVPNPFYVLIASGPLSTSTITAGQLPLPYPEYTNVGEANGGGFNSYYNSFQLKVQRRFPGGGMLLVAYDDAKFIDNP
jgi:hypothetical protein